MVDLLLPSDSLHIFLSDSSTNQLFTDESNPYMAKI